MAPGFKNRGILIPEKRRAQSSEFRHRVPQGPETPAPTRGGSGMASSLVSTWCWGPPARRRRAEIPDLIAINPHGKLSPSGATEFPGHTPGSRIPHPTSRAIFSGTWLPRPSSREIRRGIRREISCRIQVPGKSSIREIHRAISRGEFGRDSRISLFFCHSAN